MIRDLSHPFRPVKVGKGLFAVGDYMERQKTPFVFSILFIFGMAGVLLLMGLTFFQVYILATYHQGLPAEWQQILIFTLLLLAGGVAVLELSCPRRQV